MRRSQQIGDKKFFLIVASIVLLSVLLSSSYSYANIEEASSVNDVMLNRAAEDTLIVSNMPIEVSKPRVPLTSVELDIAYETMSLNSMTTLSAKDLDLIFANTYMAGLGEVFKEAEATYDINAAALASIGVHESGWGSSSYARNRNNLFGFGAYTSNPDAAQDFKSLESSIMFVAGFLKTHYLEEGGKYYGGSNLAGMNSTYAADKNWTHNIATIWGRMESGYFL